MPLSRHVLEKYVTTCFIETGTNYGRAVDLALEVGFPENDQTKGRASKGVIPV